MMLGIFLYGRGWILHRRVRGGLTASSQFFDLTHPSELFYVDRMRVELKLMSDSDCPHMDEHRII